MKKLLKWTALCGMLLCVAIADPVSVRHPRGYIHGFLLVKDSDDKLIGTGDVVQRPAGNRVTNTMTLHFRDGSLYEETTVFSQRRTFQLISYKQVQKGPSFKTPSTMSFNVANGNVNIEYTSKHGNEKDISDHMTLPNDLANGLVPTMVTEFDPKVETVLSMLVSTPKPRVVKLKISAGPEDTFFIGGEPKKATHYIIKIDIGGVAGVAAKVVGKQPPPVHVWSAAGAAPMFLKSEGQLYEDGPIWRIELTSPRWSQNPPAH